MARRRATGVAAYVTPAATAKTMRYRITSWPGGELGVRRELRAQVGDVVTHAFDRRVVVAAPKGATDERRDLSHLRLPHPRRGRGRRPDAHPACLEGRAGVVGH